MRQGTRRVTLIGAPVDLGSGGNGSAGGPAALRRAGLADALRQRGYDVRDRGDVAGLVNIPGLTVGSCRHLKEIAANSLLIRDAVGSTLAEGAVPLLMGGDHSLAIGSLAAVARHCAQLAKPLFVLWLDAHADFNTPASSPTGKVYGMPVAVAAGEGHPALTGIGHAIPMLDLARVTQVGVRSIDPLEAERVRARGLRVHGPRDMLPIVEEALTLTRRAGGHLHLSFDVDFLDPSVAPGVGLAEPGGPSFDEAQACMTAIAESGLLASMDVVEMNPGCDPSGDTARRVVKLTEGAFLYVPSRAAAE
jgi:arginase